MTRTAGHFITNTLHCYLLSEPPYTLPMALAAMHRCLETRRGTEAITKNGKRGGGGGLLVPRRTQRY